MLVIAESANPWLVPIEKATATLLVATEFYPARHCPGIAKGS
jgi:hypothetical protein